MMISDFRMIPTRRSLEGDWFPSWDFTGNADDAIRSATEFYGAEGVPVLVRRRAENGVLFDSLGVFADRKLRAPRVLR